MFEIKGFLILTHFMAFMLGVIFMIILNIFKGHHHNMLEVPAKKSTKIQDSRSTSEKEVQEQNPLKDKSTVTESASQQKILSPKEWKKNQRKEERARKRQEEKDRKATQNGAKLKGEFNPRISKPSEVGYQSLAVSDGKLCPCEMGQTQYYRCWTYEGKLFYEFNCDKSKEAKAINNRSAILDPFCIKDPNSVPVDNAKSVIVEEFGEMDTNYNIVNKSTIKFE